MTDAVEILKVAVGIKDTEICDVDGDGVLTVSDAVKVLKYVARLINSL